MKTYNITNLIFWAAKVDSYYMKLFASKSNQLPAAESWFYVIFDIAHDTALHCPNTKICKFKAKSLSVLTCQSELEPNDIW